MLIQKPPAEIGGNVWMLGTAPYPVYLVRGRREGAIIEGGISALGPVLRRQLAELGVGPEFVRQAVITHAHPDHVMAIPTLREMFPGVQVIASAIAAATLGVEKAVAFFRQVDAGLTDVLTKNGTITEAPPAVNLPENRIAVDRTVSEGDAITIDGVDWSVLATPGHSDCSISLYNTAQRVLVVSDATGYYMPSAAVWWPNYFTDYGVYLHSMERLAAIDAEVLCLSHNAAIRGADDVRKYFADAIAVTRQYHERIISEVKAGKAVRQLAEELGAEVYAQMPLMPLDFFQKNCGLLAKLSLKHEGLAAK